MRFRRLELIAFGPFSEQVLDLSSDAPGGLHVIYGPNEAGKSTALRAVGNFLFGIPARSPDTHLHAGPKLCIGASLEAADGSTFSFRRRKKRKDSLRDADDQPVDEVVLKDLLGGVDAASFHTLFGLDHERLKEGGQALLEERGEIGESLFEAGVGGRGLYRAMELIDRELAELFKPRASTTRLKRALDGYEQARKAFRDSVRPPEKWLEQKAEIDAARTELAAIEAKRRELYRERERLERIRQALGPLARRREVLEKLAGLEHAPELPPNARGRRERAERDSSIVERELERLAADLARAEAELAALAAPSALADVEPARMDEIRDRLGNHRQAAAHLLKRRGEAQAIERAVTRDLGRLGLGASFDAAEALRLPKSRIAEIRGLSQEHDALTQRLGAAERRVSEAERELATASVPQAPPGRRDEAALEAALIQAQEGLTVSERLTELEIERRAVSRSLEQRAEALGLELGGRDILKLAVPLRATVDHRAAELGALAVEREELERQAAAFAAEASGTLADLAALEAHGSVPSEAALGAVRAERAESLAVLRKAEKPSLGQWQAFELALARADEVADRLRREAGRVTEHARLVARRSRIAELSAGARAALEAVRERYDRACEAWQAEWQGVSVGLRSPEEMRDWLARFDEVRRGAEREIELEVAIERLSSELRALDSRVASAIGEKAPERGPLETSLRKPLLERLRSDLFAERARREEEKLRRVAAERLMSTLERERAEAETERAALANWRARWVAAVRPLHIAPSASPAEVLALLDELGEVFRKLDELERLRQRIVGIERDANAFAGDLAQLHTQYAPDLGGEPLEVGAEELVRRYRLARDAERDRKRLRGDIERLSLERSQTEERRDAARAELRELMQRLGAARLDQLGPLERDALAAATLRAERERLESELRQTDESLTLDEIIGRARGHDRSSVSAERDELDHQIEEANDALHDVKRRIEGLEQAREHYSDDRTADAAQQLEARASEVSEHVRRFALLRLARSVLDREVLRYRERNQGPVLSIAGPLFSRLTLGDFSGLGTGLEERVLRCIRREGQECGVEELSEGTQYQLYFALRLATLERYLEHREPIPLILDDALIHFDELRLQAAFGVLGELARRIQVLYFTHRAGDCGLARRAVPPGVLSLHELGVGRSTARRDGARAAG